MNVYSVNIERLKHWSLKGGIAIIDQGVYSGSNFLVNIMLARWLPPDHYGAYSIGFAISMFFLQLLLSYILEPMGVLGPSSYGGNLRNYLAAQVRLYFFMVVPVSLLFVLLIYLLRQFMDNSLVSNTVMIMGLFLSFTLLPWVMRRIYYVLGRPDISAKGSTIYAVLLIPFIFFLKQVNDLTVYSAATAVAISSLVAGLFLCREYGWSVIRKGVVSFRTVSSENWIFGRWLIAAGLLITIGGQAQIFLAGGLLSVESAGIVNAMQAFAQPMTLSITAIAALVTPELASDYAKNDIGSFKRKSLLMTGILSSIVIVYVLLLYYVKIPLELVIYGGKFSNFIHLIPLFGLIPLVMAIVSGMQYSLQAAQRPYAILIACFFWIPTSLLLGTIATQLYGLVGLAYSTIIGYICLATVIAFLYWYWLVKPFKQNKD